MSKRQKLVFQSNDQVCHVWASQSQDEGHNSKGNIYFHGPKIYSYGSHYLMAQIHQVNNAPMALVNSYGYSSATCGHRSHCLGALRGRMDYFLVPDPSNPRSIDNENYFVKNVLDLIHETLNMVRIEDPQRIQYRLDSIRDEVKQSNKFLESVGFKPIIIPQDMLDACRERMELRLKRFHELNTPEQVEKRRIKTEKAAQLKAEKQAELRRLSALDNAQKLEAWKNGANVRLSMSMRPEFDLARVEDGNKIVTTRGAVVPKDAGLEFVRRLLAGSVTQGERIGSFTVDEVDATKIKIGCHKFLISELKETLGDHI